MKVPAGGNSQAAAVVERWVTNPEWATDCIITDVAVAFGWLDRWRLLLGRPCRVTVKTWTAGATGRVECLSRADVDPVWPRRSGPGMIAEIDRSPDRI